MRRVRITKATGGATHNSQHLPGPPITESYSEGDLMTNDMIQEVPREQSNVEVEKGETIHRTSLDGLPFVQKVGGKRHAQGGTPVDLEPGAFVFSDNKTLSKDLKKFYEVFNIKSNKTKTFADVSKKYYKALNEASLTLVNPDADRISKQTAELTVANITYKLGQLALIQEGVKGFPDGVPEIAHPYLQLNGLSPEDIQGINPEELMQQYPVAEFGLEVPDGIDQLYQSPETEGSTIEIKEKTIDDPTKYLIGASAINYISSAKRDARNQGRLNQLLSPDYYAQEMDTDRGDWMVNSGSFRPDQMTPIEFTGRGMRANRSLGYQFMQGGGEFDPTQGVFYRDGQLFDIYGNSAPDDVEYMQDGGQYDPNQDTLLGKSGAIEYYKQPTNKKKKNYFGKVTDESWEQLKANNPWYDWTDVDPTNPEHIKKFQEIYNGLVEEGNQLKVDGKFGEQTASARLPWERPSDEPQQENEPEGDPRDPYEPDEYIDPNTYTGKDDAPWWLQDKIATTGALLNRLGLRKTLPWSPYIDQPYVDATFVDPERALHSMESIAQGNQDMINAYADPASASARMSSVSGEMMKGSADILAQYNNQNVGISNQRDAMEMNAFLNAQNMASQAARSLYDGTAIANQQYDNSVRQANDTVARQLVTGITNAEQTATLNDMYGDQFYIDPTTGGRIRWTGKGKPWGEPDPQSEIESMAAQFKALKKEFPNVSDEDLFKYLSSNKIKQSVDPRETALGTMYAQDGGTNKLRRVRIK